MTSNVSSAGCETPLTNDPNDIVEFFNDPNEVIEFLVEVWCERKDYKPLALVLPAWINNNGLTDGWKSLLGALKHAYAECMDLPPDERDALKQVYVAINNKWGFSEGGTDGSDDEGSRD
jgi:hypothetical protein